MKDLGASLNLTRDHTHRSPSTPGSQELFIPEPSPHPKATARPHPQGLTSALGWDQDSGPVGEAHVPSNLIPLRARACNFPHQLTISVSKRRNTSRRPI